MSRRKATLCSAFISVFGGLLCALSFGPLSETKIFGMTFFNLFDYVSSNVCLPIGGLVCSFFVGWLMDRKILKSELTNNGKYRMAVLPILVFFLKWICPAAIFLIFLNSIGII
ncbi:MAG: hypothetical protein K2K64_08605 [Muribaculaceae bacterium]|nr:hypothetical protein [Muribaculaceae bacterium]